ncbi:bolA-like protein 3 isoform X2 [Symphalangus syndactylus]|uniref:bolA-like protein 3 isoform X2 n=1 Tax=Symphalangus syndactylus TaxID=9590 RepID=UPI002442027F|nr:bolA-like protein 3 isoform X3 [Symphalangus syndactylus]
MAAWSPAAAAPLLRGIRGLPLHHRMFATQTEGELRVTQILKEKFPRATAIKVTDISGTKRRNQRNAWIADIYLCPQTLTTPWLHRCRCLRPWMNFTAIILP